MKVMRLLFLSALTLLSTGINYAADNVTVENGVVNLPGEILFVPGSDTMESESSEIIDAIAEFMKKILMLKFYVLKATAIQGRMKIQILSFQR
jgi:hypothetical protein